MHLAEICRNEALYCISYNHIKGILPKKKSKDIKIIQKRDKHVKYISKQNNGKYEVVTPKCSK